MNVNIKKSKKLDQKVIFYYLGFLLGMLGLPLTIGPPIAGFIYDHVGKKKTH